MANVQFSFVGKRQNGQTSGIGPGACGCVDRWSTPVKSRATIYRVYSYVNRYVMKMIEAVNTTINHAETTLMLISQITYITF